MEAITPNQTLNMDSLRRLNGIASKSDMLDVASMSKDDPEQAQKLAAREFTGMFMGQLLKAMRSTVEVGDFMHGGQAEETFQGMLDDEWARQMAYTGDINDKSNSFVGMVYDSLKRRSMAEAYGSVMKNGENGASDNIGVKNTPAIIGDQG